MAGELADVLRGVISKAAKLPPGAGTEELARLRKRYKDAGKGTVFLCDLSGSMGDYIGTGNMTKIQHLEVALKDLLADNPKAIIVVFASWAKQINSPEDLFTCGLYGGATRLAKGLELVAQFKPARTVIISDGIPTDEPFVNDAVDKVTGRIDCVYCGPDGHPAVAYLQSLARRGGGSQMTFDGCRELNSMIRGLLSA